MTELVIVRGLPGCGKTTYARAWVAEDRKNRARVNRDDLRQMVDDGEYEKGVTEGRILVIRNSIISGLLRGGVSVISDDTNLPNHTIRDLVSLARKAGAEFRIHDMTNIDVAVALAQNADRQDKPPVHSSVIEDMYRRFIKGRGYPLPVALPLNPPYKYVPYEIPSGKQPWAIIVDIDGTVALKGTRDPYDESRVSEDQPNPPVVDLVWDQYRDGYEILFCSGRSDNCRKETLDWLRETFDLPSDPKLFMRKAGDTRKDSIVKYELFNENIRDNYRVKYVLDDRNQVVEMWRALGLTCLQVAPGDF